MTLGRRFWPLGPVGIGALLLCPLTDIIQLFADPVVIKQQLGAWESSATKLPFDGKPSFIVARYRKFPGFAPHKHVTLSGHTISPRAFALSI